MINIIHIIQHAVHMDDFNSNQLLFMCVRGIIVYFIGVSITRSNKKLMGIRNPFNFMLFVMLGSIFANAVVDGAAFLPIIGTIVSLIVLNFAMQSFAFHYKWIEKFIKGDSVELIKNGEINWNQMNAHSVTKRELLNELARQTHSYDLEKIELAILTSDGSINFIFREVIPGNLPLKS